MSDTNAATKPKSKRPYTPFDCNIKNDYAQKLEEKMNKENELKGEGKKKESRSSLVKRLLDLWYKNKLYENSEKMDGLKESIKQLQHQIETIENQHNHIIRAKDSQIKELEKATNLFNIEKPENIALLTKICEFASFCHAYKYVQGKLSDDALEFCSRFTDRETSP